VPYRTRMLLKLRITGNGMANPINRNERTPYSDEM
jgi:hypothetical protein